MLMAQIDKFTSTPSLLPVAFVILFYSCFENLALTLLSFGVTRVISGVQDAHNDCAQNQCSWHTLAQNISQRQQRRTRRT